MDVEFQYMKVYESLQAYENEMMGSISDIMSGRSGLAGKTVPPFPTPGSRKSTSGGQRFLGPGLPFLFLMALLAVIRCNVAPTVTITPEYVQTPSEDLGTIYPHIQLVYPGSLQTLDVPQPYLTDISPDAANFVVVFSHGMENDASEMAAVFTLYEDDIQIPITISPAGSSKYFIITPSVNIFKENTEYSLSIYKFGYVDNEAARSLNFENLVEPPAISLNPINPDFVSYKFRTGTAGSKDLIKPQILFTMPSDGESDVDPNIPKFQIIFSDNNVPMIDPATVNEFTILLFNVTVDPSTPLKINVNFDDTDNDFKTVNIVPIDTLINNHQYRLRISAGNGIKDFRRNSADQADIYFSIKP